MCTSTLETNTSHENDLNIVLRPMYSEINALSRSDGSALLAQGIYPQIYIYKSVYLP